MTWKMCSHAHCCLVLMGGCGSSAGRCLQRLDVGGAVGGSGGDITDVDGEEVCCASGCDMFTCVVTATPGSVLTDQCYKEWYSYLV